MMRAPRLLAIAIALMGALDPACSRERQAPIAVEFRTASSPAATAARETIQSTLGPFITTASRPDPDALVIVDAAVDPQDLPENVPVSFLSTGSAPDVRLVSARIRGRLIPRYEGVLEVTAEATGLAGLTTRLTVKHGGVEVGSVEHTWSTVPTEHIDMPFLPLTKGSSELSVTAQPLPHEMRVYDNTIQVHLDVEDARLRVAFFEPRPSWAAGLVRRAIEKDPAFEVTSLVRTSRGIDVRTPGAPVSLTFSSIAAFDVVAVGAPEELRSPELQALREFAADRGGTIVFLPDRRPSGAYADMVADRFEEILLSAPAALQVGSDERGLRAGELVTPGAPPQVFSALASLPDGRPVIATRPLGDGTLLFSGALDAWRYRGDEAEPFAAFWRGALARAALAAPPAVSVDVEPSILDATGATRVRVRLRTLEIPATTVVAVWKAGGKDQEAEFVRVWPTGERGVLEGRFVPAREGDYELVAATGRGLTARATLRRSSADSSTYTREDAAVAATATGGVAARDPDAIVSHLRALPRRRVTTMLQPMRSGWWVLPFTLALCAEWTLRRRSGRR